MTDHDHLERLKHALQARYTIEREIGRGGMAVVYLAQDLKHERQVAIKVLRSELAASIGADRFLQEVKIAANLTHPHILPLHDSGEADGFLYYVMPYIEGESLRDKLAKEGELPVAEAVRILRDVVEALAHAHKHNVVHRDIKPDNVMLSDRHALVADFGVAKAVSEATGRQQLTTEGVALGTPTYMAPEQAAADPHIDHRADIYAVGAVAYELLTGRPPFLGTTPQMILSAHLTDTPEPVTKYRESVPPALAQLVMKCLEKKAADRWQSAEELLPQLDAFTTPSGGMTPTGTMPISAVKRTRKMAIGASAVAVIFAVIVVVMLLPRGNGVALDPNHVVVAVFRNETDDPSLDQLGKQIGHWITQGIQRASLPVAPWDLAQQSSEFISGEVAAGRVRDRIRALAEETGAGVVVSGAIYLMGDSIEIQVNVTDAERGVSLGVVPAVIGSRASERELIANVQQQVMGFLAVNFDEGLSIATNLLSNPPTFEAYQAFNEGMAHYLRGDYAGAIPLFHRAFELDSTFVAAFQFATHCHRNIGEYAQADSVLEVWATLEETLTEYERAWLEYFRGHMDGDRQRALVAIRRAAAIAPESKAVFNRALTAVWVNRPQEALDALRSLDPERGAMRGWANYWYYLIEALHMLGRHDEELEAAQRARELHSDRGWELVYQAQALAAMGRLDELNDVMDSLENTSNQSSIRQAMDNAVQILRTHGHNDAAEEVLQRAINWYDARPSAEAATVGHRWMHSWMLFHAEDLVGAQEIHDALLEEDPENLFLRGQRGFIAATRGDSVLAMEDFQWLADLDRRYLYGDNTFVRGVIAGALGDLDGAVSLLRQAHAEGFSFESWMVWDVQFDSLRDYPPFQEWLRTKG